MALTILTVSFVLLLLLGVPVAFAIGLSAVCTILWEGLPLAVVFQRMTSGMNIFSFLAIPFFIFAGELMLYGGIADRIVRFAKDLVGHIRGGLGMSNVVACTLFGGISGSAVADVSAMGAVMIPMMKKEGYHADYAVNVTTHAALVVAIKRGYPAGTFPGWERVARSLAAALPGLAVVAIIIVGILSGVFTATESAAIAVIYALVLTLFVYRSMTWENFLKAGAKAVKTTGVVLLLIGVSNTFGYLISLYEVAEITGNALSGVSTSPWVIFLLVNVILFVLGTFLDMAPTILICTPIFLPICAQYGMSPVQFGMVMLINCALGLNTPPVGTTQFVGCAIGGVSIGYVMRTIWPFYGALIATLMLVTYVPAFSLALPDLFLK